MEGDILLKESSLNDTKLTLETQIKSLQHDVDVNKKSLQKTRDDLKIEQEKHQHTKQQLLETEKDLELKQNQLNEYIKQMDSIDAQNTSNTLSLQYNIRKLEVFYLYKYSLLKMMNLIN